MRMHPPPRSTHLVSAGVFVIAALACSDFDRVLGLSGDQSPAAQSASARPEERRAVELSGTIPGLAGFFYDTSGNVIVAVKNMAAPTSTRAHLQPLFTAELARSRRRHPRAEVLVRGAQYTFLELQDWRDRLESGGVLAVAGVQWLDLDEVANRVVVGVEPSGDLAGVRALAQQRGIPVEALDVQQNASYQPQSTLQDQFRPIQGGTQIQRVVGTTRATCTLGFAALWNNQQVLLTAGHCSPNLMGTDSVAQYQPVAPLTPAESATTTAIAREIFRYSQACGSSRCASSDAAIYGQVAAQNWTLGRIARPTSGCLPGPCNPIVLTVNGYWVVDTTRASFVVNDLVTKVGSSTGTSQGFVSRTCVDVSPTHGVTYRCQMFANYGANDGDSGSPILLDIQGGSDSTVTLGGMHSGKSGNNAVFSPWSGIVQDYGSLIVVSQVQDTTRPPIPPLPSLPSDSTYTIAGPNYARSQLLYYRNILRISFDDSTSGSTIRSLFTRYNATIIGGIAGPADPEYFIQVPDPGPTFEALDSLVTRLTQERGVRWAAHVYYRTPGKIYWRRPNDGPGAQRHDWYSPTNATRPLLAIRAPLAWGCETGAYSTPHAKVGVVDYVFDVNQRDLSGTVVEPPDTSTPRPPAAVLSDTIYRSHGTAVAGVLSATGDNGVGIAGVLWQSDLTMYRYSHGNWVYPDLGALLKSYLNDAIATGVRILVFSHSLGDVGNDAHVRILRDALKPYLSSGGLIVMATGQQEGRLGFTMTVPQLEVTRDTLLHALHRAVAQLYDSGYASNIIFVGGTDDSGNFWPQGNYWTGATVLAPATNIVTLANTADFPAGTWTVNGTSWSAPYVAGVAGMLLDLDPSLTPAQVKSYILRGTRARRTDPVTGQLIPPQAVSGAPEVTYQLDAYGSLTLLASERQQIPLCGNRVWVQNNTVYAERDTATHTAEALVQLNGPRSSVNVFHGGRRIEVSDDTGTIAFAFQQDHWATTQAGATTPNGGTLLSMEHWSHDLDTLVVDRYWTAGDTAFFEYKANTFNPFTARVFDTLHLTLSRFTDGECVRRESDGDCNLGMASVGSEDRVIEKFAYATVGNRLFVAVNYLVTRWVSFSGWSPCPLPDSTADQTTCRNTTYQEVSERSDLWTVDLTTGRDSLLWPIPRQVYWLGVSEDGGQLVTGEGILTTVWTVQPRPDGSGFEDVWSNPGTVTGCAVHYRSTASGAELRPQITTSDGCTIPTRDKGTIAPVTAIR